MNYAQITSLILSIFAALIAIVAIAKLTKFSKVSKTFFEGKQAASLEDFIINQSKKINELAAQANYIEQAIKDLREIQKDSIQKIGLVRYNPFADNGGNLSFSMALLDAKNNGVVITSMHGREQNRIYSKPIIQGKSEFTLTTEEEKAITSSKIINS
ncbi:MAG: hypothetical protein JWO40_185 [Candidatus Doudnabacteria bacterium]|nr:hypothetical protein [Candidatus Doudnabacteria bacterium]